MRNILTIDVEEWFHANYSDESASVGDKKSTVRKNVEKLLMILGDFGAKATFFVLGSVAEADPPLVQEIRNQGHEIASHGYNHRLVYRQTRHEFQSDIVRSLSLLRDITGHAVVGYRAPSWSINRKYLWAAEELAAHGVTYDSSIFPMKTFLYGDSTSPRFMHHIALDAGDYLLEVPPSTLQAFSKRVAFSGGFYFRFFPYRLIRLATKWINIKEKQPVVFYLHPREIDVHQPRLILSKRDEFIHYVNLHTTEAKLRALLLDFAVTSISEYLEGLKGAKRSIAGQLPSGGLA